MRVNTIAVLFLLLSVVPIAAASRVTQGLSSIEPQGNWQLREIKWHPEVDPDFTFSTPEPSVLRVTSTTPSDAVGVVFIQFSRTDLDGKKLQVTWNTFHSYPDSRDLSLMTLFVFDQAFDRTDMENYFAENFLFFPGEWNITCAWLEGTHYPGPLGAPAGWLGWRTDTTSMLDLSSWTSDTVTVLFRIRDSWTGDSVIGDFDSFSVLDADNAEVYSYDFDGNVAMEVTGTYHDYGLLVPPGAPLANLSVVPSASEVTCASPGFCFYANISVSNVTNLYAYSFKLSYDPALLELSGVEVWIPSEWGSSYFMVQNETESGAYTLALTALAPAPAINGDITLATLSFNLTDAAYSELLGNDVQASLDFGDTMLVDNLAASILHTTEGAVVIMHIPLIPDINHDGIVDMRDIVMVALAYGSVPGQPTWNPACDLDNDGRISMMDLYIVARYYGTTVRA